MAIEVLRCPNCAAPIPFGARGEVLCAYCGHVLTNVPGAGALPWKGPERGPDDGLPRVHLEGRTYALRGLLARGETSDVFFARRDTRITELVTLKVLRAKADADLLSREWNVLRALHQSEAQGHEYFQRLLPQPVAFGQVRGDGLDPRPAAAYRWRSGFVHTLADVRRQYPSGVDPRAAVWMWKRLLELLGWVHRTGYAHGTVTPAHVLVHARDHGVVLAGWSCAVRGERLPAVVDHAKEFYPSTVWARGEANAASDLIMAARAVAWTLGGDPATGTVPASVPSAIASLVREVATRDAGAPADDAWELMERVSEAGRAAYGPPRFVVFSMPEGA